MTKLSLAGGQAAAYFVQRLAYKLCKAIADLELSYERQVLPAVGSTRAEYRGQSCKKCRERNGHQRRTIQESIILIGSDISRFSRGTGMGDLWTHCRASDQKENRLFVEGVNALPVVLDAQSPLYSGHVSYRH